jgi:ubiquinone/menaquinone biosynthesis C-methylase UbiE
MKTEKILPAKINKADIPRLYKRIAPFYDVWGKLIEAKARRRCLEMANIQDGESVLEVAVGTGLIFIEILKMNPSGRNEGIDLTEEMLAKARQRIERLGIKSNHSLRLGDAYNLEYPDNTFEVLINNYMFDLLPESDFPLILAEFSRVLRPKGRMILVNMAKGSHWYNKVWEFPYRINAAMMGGCRCVSLLPYVESSGFKNTKREFIAQMTFPSEVVYGIKP